MKFSKQQKLAIEHIYSGEINNIISYLKFFSLGEIIKLNKEDILRNFNNDAIPKTYFYHQSSKYKYSNILPETKYNDKVSKNEVNPENYKSIVLKLDFSQESRLECWNDKGYTINFYNGVYIAKSINDIIDFLTLWEYLKSEMLILEVPDDLTPEVLGLFYKKELASPKNSLSSQERMKEINYESFTYEDTHYLQDNKYELSYDHCIMCSNYFNKRIYPTTKLGIFINKHFKTTEEKTQNSALFAAWLAIFAAIFLTFLPHFQKYDTDYLRNISQDIQEIKTFIEIDDSQSDVTPKLDDIITQLNLLHFKENDTQNENSNIMVP